MLTTSDSEIWTSHTDSLLEKKKQEGVAVLKLPNWANSRRMNKSLLHIEDSLIDVRRRIQGEAHIDLLCNIKYVKQFTQKSKVIVSR